MMSTGDIVTIVATLAGIATVGTFIWTMRRSWSEDLRRLIAENVAEQITKARQKSDEEIKAVVEQVRALERDISKEYVRQRDLDRLERGLGDLAHKVDELDRFLREGKGATR
jgi:hypothetical protein